MNDLFKQTVFANLRSPDVETRMIGLRSIISDDDFDFDPFKDDLVVLLSDPSGDVRWLTAELLFMVARQGKDLDIFLKPLALLFNDDVQASWFKGSSVGSQALRATVLYWMNQKQWDNISDLIKTFQSEKPKIRAIMACFCTSFKKGDITPVLSYVYAYLKDESPDLRGVAARVLTGYYYWEQDFAAIEKMLKGEDYAILCWTLDALDDIGESGGDLTPLLSTLTTFFFSCGAGLEEDQNVKYPIRERVANVLIWHMVKHKLFRKTASFIIDGVDLKQIPEIKAIMKESKSYSRTPDK